MYRLPARNPLGAAMRLSRWSREPLLHFVVLGALVFGVYRWVAPSAPSKRIVLSPSLISGLRQDHLRRSGALPTDEEERALIEQFLDTEVLYREALALGLDRGDIIVRRRLVQKMEFLTEGVDPIAEPMEQELIAYRETHADRYAIPAQVTMTHVFVGRDRHADAEPAARALRSQLGAGADPASMGDPFVRGREFVRQSERELAAVFGDAFAAQVWALPVGEWSAPIGSSYGVHLVRVSERIAGRLPALDDIRSSVRRDWQTERRSADSRVALDRLRRHYDIRVERAATTLALR